MDTAIQAIARHRVSSSPSPPDRPNAGGFSPSCHECTVQVEPLALEVCLFGNNRCSPSIASSSGLIGCGTMVLTPVILAEITAGDERTSASYICQKTAYQPSSGRARPLGEAHVPAREGTTSTATGGKSAITTSHTQQEAHRSSLGKEVVLFEPGSGKRVASIVLGVNLSLHQGSRGRDMTPPAGSPRVADAATNLGERLPKVSKNVSNQRG